MNYLLGLIMINSYNRIMCMKRTKFGQTFKWRKLKYISNMWCNIWLPLCTSRLPYIMWVSLVSPVSTVATYMHARTTNNETFAMEPASASNWIERQYAVKSSVK